MVSIVILIDQYINPYAGTESQVYKLIMGLVGRGFSVRLGVLRDSEYIRSGKLPIPVDVIGVHSVRSPRSVYQLLSYARRMRNDGVDLVHGFFNDVSLIGPPIFWSVGIPFIISRRDMGFWYTKLHRVALPWTGFFAAGVVCNSKAVAQVTKRMERFPDHKVKVIYNGYPNVDTEIKSGSATAPGSDGHGPFVVGIVANIRPIKRIEDLIYASDALSEAGILFEIHVVGGGDSGLLELAAADMGLSERVRFWGQRENVHELIDGFDIAVLCSESEGFSNSIIEYMRCGKPVVCTDAGGNAEIVEHDLTGYLYPAGDYEELGRCLLELASSPEKIREMGHQGLNRVRKYYTLARMLDEHEALYDALIKTGRDDNA